MAGLRSFLRSTEGAAGPEFGVISAFLLIFTIGAVDIGRLGYRSMQVKYAAGAGGAYAVAHGFDSTSIASAITSATGASSISASPSPQQWCGCPTSSGISSATCGTTCASTAKTTGVYATASASAPFSPFFKVSFLNYPATLSASVVVRTQ